MAAEVSLTAAAYNAVINLKPLWAANTLKARLTTFANDLQATFPDQISDNRPVGNWLGIIAALADQMPVAAVPFTDFMTAADYVYKACWMANQLDVQNLISAAQAAAMLAEYNADF
jgi:hypothetical protein